MTSMANRRTLSTLGLAVAASAALIALAKENGQ